MWGDPTPEHTIYINGRTRTISKNLRDFLHQARLSQARLTRARLTRARLIWATEYFWIDSICLDQDDHSERNEQVQRMGDIYSQAHHVVSWLGKNSCKALQALAKLHCGYHFRRLNLPDAIGHVLKIAYWGRVWIVQEVVCAQHCYVAGGPVVMWLETFVQRVEAVMNSEDLGFFIAVYTSRNSQVLSRLVKLRCHLKNDEHLDFVTLVAMMSGLESTREVDQVYGLLGLASRLDPDFDPRALGVNYDKTLEHIFWDIACQSIGTLDRGLYDDFICSMPFFSTPNLFDRLEPSLESYVAAALTPEKWRTRARVASQVFHCISGSTIKNNNYFSCMYPSVHKDIKSIKEAWTETVKCALSDVYLDCKHRKSASNSSPLPNAGRLWQFEGFMLGLHLILCILTKDDLRYEVSCDDEAGSIKWLCATHMAQHVVVEAIDVVHLTFEDSGDAELGVTCAAPSKTCSHSALSSQIADEGLILELRGCGDHEERFSSWLG